MAFLTPHFTLDELIRSEWAERHGTSNVPGLAEIAALTRLCQRVLEPLREHLARPIHVLSGYRSAAVNFAVGGAPTSQHVWGEAADLVVPGLSNIEVCDAVVRLVLPFDQLIYEFGEKGWVHVSYGPRNRREPLRASWSGGGVVYSPLELERQGKGNL